ncbi:MAG: 30S ribosomal protein S6 [Deltaproteobacteria bacterium]|nr:30S ribosomal protein S6 [Deltaproteobacteria bacterium]
MSEVARKYELLYIHPGNLPSDDVEKVDEILNGTLERMAGELLHREDWGVRTLAYPVKKHADGRYILVRFSCLPECLAEIERRFKINEAVIKFLTVRLPDDFVQVEVLNVPVEGEGLGDLRDDEMAESSDDLDEDLNDDAEDDNPGDE